MTIYTYGGKILTVGGKIATSPNCCCLPLGCCTNVPRTLHATFANVAGCACLDGVDVTLTWNGVDRWVGTATLGSCGEDVTVMVGYTGSAGIPCVLALEVNIDFSNLCSGTITQPASSFCDPISVLPFAVLGSAPNTCCGGGALSATLTITE